MGCSPHDNSVANARLLDQERQARVNQGVTDIDKAFSGFDDKFYQGRQNDYIKFAFPQLMRQLAVTQKNATVGMANRGLLGSTASKRLAGNLGYEANIQKQNVADTAIQTSQNLRKEVEGQRGSLIAQLQASADPTTAATQALSSASQFTAPSTFAPLGNAFGQFSNLYLAGQANKEFQPLLNNNTGNTGAAPAFGASAFTIRK